MRFLPTLGRLPNTWLNIALIVMSGMVEGFGLALFVPLLHVMGGQDASLLPAPFSHIPAALERIGLTMNSMTLLVLIVVISLGALAFGYAQKKMMIGAKSVFTKDIRNRLFSSILYGSWGKASERPHGEVINLMIADCSRSGNALGFELMAVATCVQIVLYLAFSTVVSWQLMVIVIGFGAIMFLVVRPLTQRAKSYGSQTGQANRNLNFFSLEYLRGLKLLKATANEQLATQEISEKIEDVYRVSYGAELNATRLNFLVQALPVVLLAAIIGLAHEVLEITVPVVLVFLLFMMRIAPRAAQLQQFLHSYHLNGPAVGLVDQTIEDLEAMPDNPNTGGLDFDRINSQISLEDVDFEYPGGDTPALNSVSMTIGRNQMVAIVGGSGAGKSTVMDIITGLQKPDFGHVRIDDTELSDFCMSSWRKKIGMVTQEAITFNASLRDNLRIFKSDATEEELNRALSIAHLGDLVESLPDGLETKLGESGVRFSGGQLQRIALARALTGQPELLLLDEATSALDNESERLVQDAITKLLHTTTVVVIAHRLSTVRRADVIYVMEGGSIVESGSYDTLMEQGGRFARLRKLEFS